MQNVIWRKAFLFCFSLVFAVLLMTGAPRLIASSEETAYIDTCIHPVRAFFCVGQLMQEPDQLAGQDANGRFILKRDDSVFRVLTGSVDSGIVHTDANGNVVVSVNYMRAVYQVFALGDGFV